MFNFLNKNLITLLLTHSKNMSPLHGHDIMFANDIFTARVNNCYCLFEFASDGIE